MRCLVVTFADVDAVMFLDDEDVEQVALSLDEFLLCML